MKFLKNSNHEITIADGSKHKVEKIGDFKLNNDIVFKIIFLLLNFILISYSLLIMLRK